MLQISEIIKKTEEMFDLFNEHFYDNELTRPAITVSPDGGRGAYGWTVTTLAPEAEAWIKETIGKASINASRLQEFGTTKGVSKKSKNRSIKYVCPCCGTIIQATREVNVICGNCGEPFEQA